MSKVSQSGHTGLMNLNGLESRKDVAVNNDLISRKFLRFIAAK